MNSDPLSESTPRIGNGMLRAMSLSAARTHLAVLSGTERFSVQPVAMSVTVKVNAWPPARLPPSCQTKSISTNPGRASSHSAQVRTGIWLLSSDPGFVPTRPWSLVSGSLISQAAIDGGCRHRRQQCGGALIDGQLAEMTQHCHQFAQHGRESFAGRTIPHWPPSPRLSRRSLVLAGPPFMCHGRTRAFSMRQRITAFARISDESTRSVERCMIECMFESLAIVDPVSEESALIERIAELERLKGRCSGGSSPSRGRAGRGAPGRRCRRGCAGRAAWARGCQ